MPFSPVQTAVSILVALAVVGAIVQFIATRRKFAGFEYIAGAIRGVRRTLKGEISRDGSDIVVVGEYRELPVFVRFSNTMGDAGLTIHMAAKASFALSVAPISAKVPNASQGEVRSGDAAFDNRFTIRTDQPTQVSLLLTRTTISQLQKLCCSSATIVNIRRGEMELTEAVIPQPQTWEHVTLHLQGMRALAEALRSIPGSEGIDIVRQKRDRHIPGRVAIAAGVVAAVILVLGTSNVDKRRVEAGPFVPAGITPNDALSIRNLDGWRLASTNDFPPEAQAWLLGNGLQASGLIMGDFSGSGHGDDVAYVLTNEKHQFRVVVIANHTSRYDAEFPALAAVTRIPKSATGAVQWNGAAPQWANGDGLLIVMNVQDRASGLAIFLGPQRITSAAPADYQAVRLR